MNKFIRWFYLKILKRPWYNFNTMTIELPEGTWELSGSLMKNEKPFIKGVKDETKNTN